MSRFDYDEKLLAAVREVAAQLKTRNLIALHEILKQEDQYELAGIIETRVKVALGLDDK